MAGIEETGIRARLPSDDRRIVGSRLRTLQIQVEISMLYMLSKWTWWTRWIGRCSCPIWIYKVGRSWLNIELVGWPSRTICALQLNGRKGIRNVTGKYLNVWSSIDRWKGMTSTNQQRALRGRTSQVGKRRWLCYYKAKRPTSVIQPFDFQNRLQTISQCLEPACQSTVLARWMRHVPMEYW